MSDLPPPILQQPAPITALQQQSVNAMKDATSAMARVALMPTPPASTEPGLVLSAAPSAAPSVAPSSPSSVAGSAPASPQSRIFPPGITRAPSPGYKKPRKKDSSSSKESQPDYLKLILTAPIYDLAKETPLHFAEMLSARIGNQIYLKREDTQPAFSFKIRGAYNRLKHLTPEERQRGVVCCSAGNHAQGVALAAKKLGIKATIVMPRTAPDVKTNNVRRLGGIVVLEGDDLEGARMEAARLEREMGYVNVPPFDDPYIIAGQGTVGVEILRQIPNGKLDAIFVCCGGGGLLAGIATYVKRLYPDVKVIGVEEVDQDSMSQALTFGHPITMPEIDLFADGTAVRRAGEETFRLVQEFVDEMVLVTNDEICAAIKDVFSDTRSILEPSGALSLAGCKRWIADNNVKDGIYVAVTSGANMDFNRLRFVAERAEIGEETEALISVMMPEQPGSFLQLLNAILPRAVTELSYRFHRLECAHVFATFKVPPGLARDDETAKLLEKLQVLGMSGIDISKNEFAKSHARYLVGGRTTIMNERVVRAEFRITGREMIRDLLKHFSPDFNQLLFHFKNTGGDLGKVLMGFEVPEHLTNVFNERVESLSKKWRVTVTEETDNIVFRHFMVGDTVM
ncbi:tryptophan synthase beta subunit-like PLP-dependent enzyme [Blastocladiella britannica]|nr:tryptophan synthase beta subunit-like PLP-dependent enzyme [Blastocladiella britannica]